MIFVFRVLLLVLSFSLELLFLLNAMSLSRRVICYIRFVI
jgi:hypothetical protein